MIDLYTKIILTVIAGSLLVIVVNQQSGPAKAAFGDCGKTFQEPCYMHIVQ